MLATTRRDALFAIAPVPARADRTPFIQPHRHRGIDIGLLPNTRLNHLFCHARQAAGWIHEILRMPIREIQMQLLNGHPALIPGQLFKIGVNRLIDIGEVEIGFC